MEGLYELGHAPDDHKSSLASSPDRLRIGVRRSSACQYPLPHLLCSRACTYRSAAFAWACDHLTSGPHTLLLRPLSGSPPNVRRWLHTCMHEHHNLTHA